jgi:hypothetical protein
MAMYLCRWPNGEFSIVNAATKDDAIVLLDEWGNAEQASLKRMPDCMFDFRLRDDGEMELADIGGATQEFIMETCYPELAKASSSAEWDDDGWDFSSSGQETIRKAVESERTRLWKDQPKRRRRKRSLDATFRSRPAPQASSLIESCVKPRRNGCTPWTLGRRNQTEAVDARSC